MARPAIILAIIVLLLPIAPVDASAATSDRERRCLAMIAYAEAATEGPAGMLAVMKVVHNRVVHPHFAGDACAVALEPGQFQPVGDRPSLRLALAAPAGRSLSDAVGATTPSARLRLVAAWRLAAAAAIWPARDPTGGALYFVNPRQMDPGKCAWFAKLKRTAVIGAHVFMRHYLPGEASSGPALDCALAGSGRTRSRTLAAAR